MARQLAEIQAIHNQLQAYITQRALCDGVNEDGLTSREEAGYFRSQRDKFLHDAGVLQPPAWFNGYQERINFLRMEMEALMNPEEINHPSSAKRRVLRLAIFAAQQLVQHSLDYLETLDLPSRQTRYLRDVELLQKQIDDGLSTIFPDRAKVFNLRLTDLRQDFEDAYVTNHGTGFLGFFILPIKRFFRQTSRDEELRFIESIDTFLTNNDHILPAERESIKLSALNLVRFKIQGEFFGENSLLFRLVNERLTEENSAENYAIVENFVDFCTENAIEVPEGLTGQGLNELQPN